MYDSYESELVFDVVDATDPLADGLDIVGGSLDSGLINSGFGFGFSEVELYGC